MNSQKSSRRVVGLIGAGVYAFVVAASTADARYADRWYRMGDDPAQGVSAGPVELAANGDTYDSIGTLGQGNLQDLTPHGSPLYVNISSSRPVPAVTANNWAIQFDGVDDYLIGSNLNIPSESQAGISGGENYAGISDRGYQLWVKPTALPATGFASRTLDDGEQHEFRITATGFWSPETRNDAITSTATVTLNAWTHIAQVRPNGVNGGSLAWVSGVAVVSQTGDYATSLAGLIIGANSAPDGLGGTVTPPEAGSYFQGLIDEIDMFVIGGTYGTFNYTKDNGYFTDVFLPSKNAFYSYVDATGPLGSPDGHNDKVWVNGDINFDGVKNQLDVNAFVAGWRSTNAATILGNGPKFGDYITLGKGDLDLDGNVDIDDWVLLRSVFTGSGVSLPTAAELGLGVPEPMSASLAVFGLIVLSNRPRWNRQHD